MHDLFTPRDHLTEGYSRIYEALSKLREGFHRSGRIDDSNAKLDEVSKLLATYLAFKNHQIPKFPTAHSPSLVSGLQTAFAATARLPQYQLDGGASIFGAQPSLVIRPGDESLAADLVALVRDCVDLAFDLRAHGRPFDILNEAFGHFVRRQLPRQYRGRAIHDAARKSSTSWWTSRCTKSPPRTLPRTTRASTGRFSTRRAASDHSLAPFITAPAEAIGLTPAVCDCTAKIKLNGWCGCQPSILSCSTWKNIASR